MALMGLISCTLIACVADPIAFMCDGKKEVICFWGNFLGNGYLYLSNMLAGTCWLYFLISHMHIPLTERHKRFLGVVNALGCLVLIANIFTPVAFRISAENVYSRGPMFWFYLGMECLFILDSVWLYTRARVASGFMKRFPVWLFLIPVVTGLTIQTFNYGQSTVWPFVAVSLGSVLSCIQNEMILQDKLTGLYNRFYLDNLRTGLNRKGSMKLLAVMLDLNHFKNINDLHGHTEGDRALVETGELLVNAVGMKGTVIRYAGDEFIVLVPDQGDVSAEAMETELHAAFERFNESGKLPYRLEAAIGCCRVDLQTDSVDKLLKEIDERMYGDKPNRREASV